MNLLGISLPNVSINVKAKLGGGRLVGLNTSEISLLGYYLKALLNFGILSVVG